MSSFGRGAAFSGRGGSRPNSYDDAPPSNDVRQYGNSPSNVDRRPPPRSPDRRAPPSNDNYDRPARGGRQGDGTNYMDFGGNRGDDRRQYGRDGPQRARYTDDLDGGYSAGPPSGGYARGASNGAPPPRQSNRYDEDYSSPARSYGNEPPERSNGRGGRSEGPPRGNPAYDRQSSDQYPRREPQQQHSDYNRSSAQPRGGGYNSSSRGGDSGGYQNYSGRDEYSQRSNRQDNSYPSRGGGRPAPYDERPQNYHSYGGDDRPQRNNSGYDQSSYGNRPPRGSISSGRGASRYGDENSVPSYGGSGRGGSSYDEPRDNMASQSYGGSTRGASQSYGGSARGGGRSYESRDDNQSYGGSAPRGGGRSYDDRRGNATEGYGSNTGYSGYSASSSANRFDDNRPERTAENFAPRNYRPMDRNIEDIFNEDKEDVKKNTATIFDEDADIRVEEASVDLHADSWADMELNEKLMANITKSDYTRPRKIQQKTIPYVLDGYDVKCQGETGSGKTAAFLIPVIQKLLEDKEKGQLPTQPCTPSCLIIAPTRELVSQIYEQAQKFTYNTGITCARAYGQYNMRDNRQDLQRGCNILVACIGRLLHFVEEEVLHLNRIKYFILDEADRLLLENSSREVERIFNWPSIPPKKEIQTLLFSATLKDPFVLNMCREWMKEGKTVMITASSQSNKRVMYKVFAVPSQPAKYKYLTNYMQQITDENDGVVPRTLIFVNQKKSTDRVAVECTNAKFPATTIHGDRGQHLREEALLSFRSGKTRCLVATDVCARGIDIKEMEHVINFDCPNDKDGYLQRCGRTGRTHKGTAMSLYLESDDRALGAVMATIIKENNQEAPGFLNGFVEESDYNFGKGSASEENGDNRSKDNNDAPAEYGRPPSPPPNETINDPSANEGWD